MMSQGDLLRAMGAAECPKGTSLFCEEVNLDQGAVHTPFLPLGKGKCPQDRSCSCPIAFGHGHRSCLGYGHGNGLLCTQALHTFVQSAPLPRCLCHENVFWGQPHQGQEAYDAVLPEPQPGVQPAKSAEAGMLLHACSCREVCHRAVAD